MIPIDKLPIIERDILRYHIVHHPSITTRLNTRDLFPHLQRSVINNSVSDLVQHGYYKDPDATSIAWTDIGHHTCYTYFKDELEQSEKPADVSRPDIPHPTRPESTQKTDNIHNPSFRITPLRIVEGVIIGVLVICIVYIVSYYFHLDLTP